MVRGERPGIGTPVYRLENGGLELEKTVVVQEPSDEGYDPLRFRKVCLLLLVDNQVDVPLAVALLNIGESMELLGQ